jgi:uncharacterized membrane protein
LVLHAESTSFSGPIPPPGILEKYNEIIPNGAERIMAMAEKQSAHRESIEKRVIDGEVASQTRGSWFAFIITVLAISGGVFLIEQGKSASGLTTIITSVAGLVGVFVYSKQEQKKERIEKAEALQARRNR